jgi:hypothetical protein
MEAAWFWVRTAPTTAGRGGLCGSGWRMLGRRSGGGWGRGGAGGSAGSMGASGAGGTKASWYFRFGVGCWAKEGEAEAASVSGGSGGERMDWMRSWEAIVTVGWVSRGDPLTQAQADEAFPGHTVQCNRRLQDRSAVAMRARQGRAETRRPVGVGRRTASERLKYAAQERTLPVRLLAVAAAGAGSGAARQTGRRRVERVFDTGREREREGGRDGAGLGDALAATGVCTTSCVGQGRHQQRRYPFCAGSRASERPATVAMRVSGRANVTPKRCWRCCSGCAARAGGGDGCGRARASWAYGGRQKTAGTRGLGRDAAERPFVGSSAIQGHTRLDGTARVPGNGWSCVVVVQANSAGPESWVGARDGCGLHTQGTYSASERR